MEEDYFLTDYLFDNTNDGFKLVDINNWDKRLKMDPIHGLEIKTKDDFIGALLLLEGPNPFNEFDSSSIFY